MAVTLIGVPESLDGTTWHVPFGDTARPGWSVELTMAEDVTTGQIRCTAAHFDGRKTDDLPTKWLARFPLARCIREARLAVQQAGEPFDYELPYGSPNRANRKQWYPQLLECLESWQRLGMTPMDSYREVARRKRVEVNRVKQWVHVAKNLEQKGTNEQHQEDDGRGMARTVAHT
jgi:hypothetical protein